MCVFIVSFEYIKCKNITFAKKLGHCYFKAVFLTVKQDEILIKKLFSRTVISDVQSRGGVGVGFGLDRTAASAR